MNKPSKYDPDLETKVTLSQCETCKNKECYWAGDGIIKLYNCKNRKEK